MPTLHLKIKVAFAAALIATLLIPGVAPRDSARGTSDPRRAPILAEASPGTLRVTALDVGQGDSLLILSPTGKSVLVDGGPPDAQDTVVNALRSRGLRRLDLAVATHPHADHIGGMEEIINRFEVINFLDSGQPYTTRTYERMLRAIEDRNVTFIRARTGQTFDLGSGGRLEVLSPTNSFFTPVQPGRSKENANSVVMRLTYGRFAMLFTGDAETETEERLIRSGSNLRAQVLKIGHHGSRHATSNTFLRAVRPQAAIISCGAGNNYGHPSPETLARLRSNGVQTYRTDLHGEITVTTDGRDFKVETVRPEGARGADGTAGAIGVGGAEGAEEAPTAETVYITRTGAKYHRDGCQYLRRSRIPISLRDAKQGYTACSVCRPLP